MAGSSVKFGFKQMRSRRHSSKKIYCCSNCAFWRLRVSECLSVWYHLTFIRVISLNIHIFVLLSALWMKAKNEFSVQLCSSWDVPICFTTVLKIKWTTAGVKYMTCILHNHLATLKSPIHTACSVRSVGIHRSPNHTARSFRSVGIYGQTNRHRQLLTIGPGYSINPCMRTHKWILFN